MNDLLAGFDKQITRVTESIVATNAALKHTEVKLDVSTQQQNELILKNKEVAAKVKSTKAEV